jgi:hypothetical protein
MDATPRGDLPGGIMPSPAAGSKQDFARRQKEDTGQESATNVAAANLF